MLQISSNDELLGRFKSSSLEDVLENYNAIYSHGELHQLTANLSEFFKSTGLIDLTIL